MFLWIKRKWKQFQDYLQKRKVEKVYASYITSHQAALKKNDDVQPGFKETIRGATTSDILDVFNDEPQTIVLRRNNQTNKEPF